MNNKFKKIGIMFGIVVAVILLVLLGITITRNFGKTDTQITQEDASTTLTSLRKKLDVTTIEPRKAPVDLEEADPEEELPSIDEYPLTVEGKGDINVEIFSSPEKAGEGSDSWLNKVAEKFNSENYMLDGKSISVSIRNVSSGLAVEYIISGKYVPDAISPSNELWCEFLKAKNIKIVEKAKKLVGNTAGILLKKDVYDTIVSKYGSVNLKSIVEATVNNEISMGYTNPFISSAGLNFILSTLNSFDPTDSFSKEAIEGFESFQANVPYVAYNTMQIRESALSGSLDGLIIEYQSYYNLPELRDFVFTPYGVRHDEPLYALDISNEKNSALDQFTAYCANEESQKLATEYGFNNKEEYVSELPAFSGEEIIRAQALWKEKKDSNKKISAVFVTDISGSMEGAPLNNLKTSLINASKYINPKNSIGLVSYNSQVYINLPINEFNLNQRSYFTGAVEDFSPGGGTASFDAVITAVDMLMVEKEKNPDAKLMLFLLSDGETNTGYSLNKIRPVLQGLNIPVYTIGYNANIEALEEISAINEAAAINATTEDVVYQLKQLFNAQM